MGIGNFGLTELFVIVVLVLVFFGPREMPEIARTLARFLRDVRRNVNEIMREFEELDRSGTEGDAGRHGRGASSGGGGRPGQRVLPPEAAEPGPEEGGPEEGGPYRGGDDAPEGPDGDHEEADGRPEASEERP